jgi:hypothetical protein
LGGSKVSLANNINAASFKKSEIKRCHPARTIRVLCQESSLARTYSLSKRNDSIPENITTPDRVDAFFEFSAAVEAWRMYLNSGLNAPVDMGLCAMQLKPFLDLPKTPMLPINKCWHFWDCDHSIFHSIVASVFF